MHANQANSTLDSRDEVEMTKMKVCICGGGNIAHSMISVLSECDDVSVYAPYDKGTWAEHMSYQIGNDDALRIGRNVIRAPADLSAIAAADLVIVALPRFAIEGTLRTIDSSLHTGQTVVFLPAPAGLDTIVSDYRLRGIDTIGFQRVPYVARIREFGHRVWIGDVRKRTNIAFSRPEVADKWVKYFESRCTGGTIGVLSSFLTFTFSNSNPLLHPSRLVELLKGGDNGRYPQCPYFYAEWTDVSSELYVDADAEMFKAFKAYDEKAATADYESALAHYESDSPAALTRKMRSIESLKPILAPWKQDADGLWVPDFNSRYFTEDIPYGTKVIRDYAARIGLKTPTIDYLISSITERVRAGI